MDNGVQNKSNDVNENKDIAIALGKNVAQLVDLYEKERKEAAQLKRQLIEIERKIGPLRDENKKLKLANAFNSGGSGTQNAKRIINELVREIDDCVALLNK